MDKYPEKRRLMMQGSYNSKTAVSTFSPPPPSHINTWSIKDKKFKN
jgi:hypothetical protein